MTVSDVEVIKTTVRLLGVAVVPHVLAPVEVDHLISTLGEVNGAGVRGVLRVPLVAQLARSASLMHLVQPLVPGDPRPVRAIYFDKSPAGNWSVSWHQELTLAVRKSAVVEGFGPWSIKDGVPHVQAPAQLLEQMVAVRLHLDDCDESNGLLRVLGGSHRFGRIPVEQIRALVVECPEIVCRIGAGGALLMRPLLLHASNRLESFRHRRVLHIEYAGFDLPEPLEWAA